MNAMTQGTIIGGAGGMLTWLPAGAARTGPVARTEAATAMALAARGAGWSFHGLFLFVSVPDGSMVLSGLGEEHTVPPAGNPHSAGRWRLAAQSR
jgi:hypothetical protein